VQAAHQRRRVTPGELDAAAVEAYTQSQCHALALVLHEATGWPLVGDFDPDERSMVPRHVLVRRSDGTFVDVLRAAYGQNRLWGHDQRELTASDVWSLVRLGHMVPPDLELARSFVAPVLERAGEPNE